MRLIDADKVIADNAKIIDCEIDHPQYQDTLREIIDSAETVDAVEVVRCKDCIYYVCAGVDHIVGCEWCRLTRTIKKPDWFCADGEKWSET